MFTSGCKTQIDTTNQNEDKGFCIDTKQLKDRFEHIKMVHFWVGSRYKLHFKLFKYSSTTGRNLFVRIFSDGCIIVLSWSKCNKGSFFNYVDQILPVLDHLPTPCWHWQRNSEFLHLLLLSKICILLVTFPTYLL